MKPKKTKVVKEFSGFESLHGFDEELVWALYDLDFPPEFTGTMRFTIEYIPDEDENEAETE